MCKFCPKPSQNRKYRSTVIGREYNGPAKYNCKTENVIYLITCRKWGKQYVGETYRPFNERMKEHLRYIKIPSKYNEPTSRHFNLPEHNISDFHCRVIYIYIVNGTPKRYDQKTNRKRGISDRSIKNPRSSGPQ